MFPTFFENYAKELSCFISHSHPGMPTGKKMMFPGISCAGKLLET